MSSPTFKTFDEGNKKGLEKNSSKSFVDTGIMPSLSQIDQVSETLFTPYQENNLEQITNSVSDFNIQEKSKPEIVVSSSQKMPTKNTNLLKKTAKMAISAQGLASAVNIKMRDNLAVVGLDPLAALTGANPNQQSLGKL